MFPPLTHTLYSLASFLGPIPHFLIYSFKHPRTQVLHLALTRGISPIRIHIYNISAPRFFDFSTEAPSRSNLPPLPFFTLFLSRNSAFSLLHQSSSRQAHDPPPPFTIPNTPTQHFYYYSNITIIDLTYTKINTTGRLLEHVKLTNPRTPFFPSSIPSFILLLLNVVRDSSTLLFWYALLPLSSDPSLSDLRIE